MRRAATFTETKTDENEADKSIQVHQTNQASKDDQMDGTFELQDDKGAILAAETPVKAGYVTFNYPVSQKDINDKKYYVVEKHQATGYNLPTEKQLVTYDPVNNRGQVTFMETLDNDHIGDKPIVVNERDANNKPDYMNGWFQLTDQDGKNVGDAVQAQKGTATFKETYSKLDIINNNYHVKEVTAATTYNQSSATPAVIYEDGKNQGSVDFKETLYEPNAADKSLVVNETDTKGNAKTMDGWFKLVNDQGTQLEAAQPAQDGLVTFSRLGTQKDIDDQKYAVVETKAAKGYNLPTKPQQTLTYNDKLTQGEANFRETKEDTSIDDKDLVVHERDALTNDGTNLDGTFDLKDTATQKVLDTQTAKNGEVVFAKQDSKDDIDHGNYLVEETSPAKNYVLPTPVSQTLTWDKDANNGAATFNETLDADHTPDKSITVQEQDATTNQGTNLNGMFRLLDAQGTPVKGVGQAKATNGQATFDITDSKANIEANKYQVTETRAASGYHQSTKPQLLTYETDPQKGGQATFVETKIDPAVEDKPLMVHEYGANNDDQTGLNGKFELKKDTTVVGAAQAATNGLLTFNVKGSEADIKAGKYVVDETSPAGSYNQSPLKQTLEYSKDNAGETTFIETKQATDAVDKPIVVNETGANNPDQKGMDGWFQLEKANGDAVDDETPVQAKDGVVTFETRDSQINLSNNKYLVAETTAASGYVEAKDPKPVGWEDANHRGLVTFAETPDADHTLDKTLTVQEKKAADGTQDASMNGHFTLKQNGVPVPNDEDKPAANGVVTFTKPGSRAEIDHNEYEVVETSPAQGYNQTTEPVKMGYDDINNRGVAKFMETQDGKTIKDKLITVQQQDAAGNSKGLNGRFSLRENGTPIKDEAPVRAKDGKASFKIRVTQADLDDGKYTVDEIQAADGYNQTTGSKPVAYVGSSHQGVVTFVETLDADHTVDKKMTVAETDASGKSTGLDGTFVLEDQNGTPVASDTPAIAQGGAVTFTTKASVAALKNNQYQVEEVKQASGFNHALAIPYESYNDQTNQGEVKFVETSSDKTVSDKKIKVEETDEHHNAEQMNGWFELRDAKTNQVLEKETQAKKGEVYFNLPVSQRDIRAGKYQVVETKPVDQYNKPTMPVTVEYDGDHQQGLAEFNETLSADRVQDKDLVVHEMDTNGDQSKMDGYFQLEDAQTNKPVLDPEPKQASRGEVLFQTAASKTEIDAGKYVVEETTQADGYYKPVDKQVITYDPYHDNGAVTFVEKSNDPTVADKQLVVHEQDQNGNPANMDGQFQLEDNQGTKIGNPVPAKAGELTFGMRATEQDIRANKYQVVEVSGAHNYNQNPAKQTLVYNPKINQGETTFKETLMRRNINVTNVASDNRNVRINGRFELLDGSGKVVQGAKTASGGKVSFTNQTAGQTYYVHQTGAQADYRVNGNGKVQVNLGNQDSNVTVINQHRVKKYVYAWQRVKKYRMKRVKTYVRVRGKRRVKYVRKKVAYYVRQLLTRV